MPQKARIMLSSTDYRKLEDVCSQIKKIAEKTGVKIAGPVPLPTKRLLVPTMKSPAGEGTKTWDKWEMRIHKRLIDIVETTSKTIDALTKLNLPSGVEIDIKL